MAVPKRKKSRSRTRHRRARWKASAPDLVEVTTLDGRKVKVPGRLAAAARRGLV